MKKIVLLLFCIVLSFAVKAQDSKWKGFFKPIPTYEFQQLSNENDRAITSMWLFRPTVHVSAIQFTYNKETKGFDASSLTTAGAGVSYSHFIEVDGAPYNNFSVNGLMLFNMVPTETVQSGIGAAVTVTALRYVNAGCGYDFTGKQFFILTGVTISFNK